MKTIKQYLETKQQSFAEHEFFHLIETNPSIRVFADVMPQLSFWVMTFQDILRLNESRVEDKFFQEVAHHHRLEDEGHEIWFLHDNSVFAKLTDNQQLKTIDITFLFDKNNSSVRDSSFAIASEVFHLDDDRLRVVLLLTLESSGHIFFDRMATAMKKVNYDHALKYFSSFHLDVEHNHSCFSDELEDKLDAIVLPDEILAQGLKMIDRVYQSFNSMFDGLAQHITALPTSHFKSETSEARYEQYAME